MICELLAQSLVAWHVAGSVRRSSDGAIMIGGNFKEIRIDPAPSVLRQVRDALEPGFATTRVRVAVSPLVPS
jgi:hypothetical protein